MVVIVRAAIKMRCDALKYLRHTTHEAFDMTWKSDLRIGRCAISLRRSVASLTTGPKVNLTESQTGQMTGRRPREVREVGWALINMGQTKPWSPRIRRHPDRLSRFAYCGIGVPKRVKRVCH